MSETGSPPPSWYDPPDEWENCEHEAENVFWDAVKIPDGYTSTKGDEEIYQEGSCDCGEKVWRYWTPAEVDYRRIEEE